MENKFEKGDVLILKKNAIVTPAVDLFGEYFKMSSPYPSTRFGQDIICTYMGCIYMENVETGAVILYKTVGGEEYCGNVELVNLSYEPHFHREKILKEILDGK